MPFVLEKRREFMKEIFAIDNITSGTPVYKESWLALFTTPPEDGKPLSEFNKKEIVDVKNYERIRLCSEVPNVPDIIAIDEDAKEEDEKKGVISNTEQIAFHRVTGSDTENTDDKWPEIVGIGIYIHYYKQKNNELVYTNKKGEDSIPKPTKDNNYANTDLVYYSSITPVTPQQNDIFTFDKGSFVVRFSDEDTTISTEATASLS